MGTIFIFCFDFHYLELLYNNLEYLIYPLLDTYYLTNAGMPPDADPFSDVPGPSRPSGSGGPGNPGGPQNPRGPIGIDTSVTQRDDRPERSIGMPLNDMLNTESELQKQVAVGLCRKVSAQVDEIARRDGNTEGVTCYTTRGAWAARGLQLSKEQTLTMFDRLKDEEGYSGSTPRMELKINQHHPDFRRVGSNRTLKPSVTVLTDLENSFRKK